MAFRVDDIQGEVAALRANGVAFEEYETPKTLDGIADVGAGWAAWLKDPDGNLDRHLAVQAGRLSAGVARIRIARGSIVDLEVEAIVNAANSALQGGGGVTARSTGRPGRDSPSRPRGRRPARPARPGSRAAST